MLLVELQESVDANAGIDFLEEGLYMSGAEANLIVAKTGRGRMKWTQTIVNWCPSQVLDQTHFELGFSVNASHVGKEGERTERCMGPST